MANESHNKNYVNTPYDDVFRTLVVDQCKLVIPVINEIFGEHYTGQEEIIFSMNEHFMNAQDGVEDKKITDSSFSIIGKTRKKYLLECQSTPDNSMLVRIFEYSTQIALDEGTLADNVLTVEIPNSAVLFLRATKNTADEMKIQMITPGGTVAYPVKVIKSQKYKLDEIFAKNLLFLIPFYIFVYDNQLKNIDKDLKKLDHLKSEYHKIMEHLDLLYHSGKITALTHRTLIEMSEKVVDSLAAKYENVRKGVKDIMGGRVLDYEAKTIFNQGRAEGKTEGKIEGNEESKRELILSMHENGLSDELIAKIVKADVAYIRQILDSLTITA